MKIKLIALFLCQVLLLAACGTEPVPAETTAIPSTTPSTEATEPVAVTQLTETQTVPMESMETLPAAEPEESDFVLVRDFIPDILVELKYATSDNFLGRAVYEFHQLYLRYGTVKKLIAVQQELKAMGLRLKIWDGFRPVSAQRALWKACPDPNYVSNPDTGTSPHCCGNTVDITLAAADGHELEMPTGFDDFTALADRSYFDCTDEASKNAQLLEDLMEKHGFTGYYNEWWHYQDAANYPVAEEFDFNQVFRKPSGEADQLRIEKDPLYYADCRQFISLRVDADRTAEVITQINAGELFYVLEWTGDFALVEYNGLIGYVMSSYVSPA